MPTSLSPKVLLGRLAVALLRALRSLPPGAAFRLLSPFLPLYIRLRRGRARRLEALFAALPPPLRPAVRVYYRRRLDLFLRTLRLHGAPLPVATVDVEGMERYRAALAAGRPVALIGLHMGVVELLHRLPEPAPGRPFRVLTARAFSPVLTEYLREGRERDGKRVLGNRELSGGLREVLAGSGVLACMADQVPGSEAATLDLWGKVRVPWPSRLLVFLAERGFLLMPVSTLATDTEPRGAGPCRYVFHPAWDFPGQGASGGPVSEGRGALESHLAERLRAFLEGAIAAAPDQWNWSYPGYRPVP